MTNQHSRWIAVTVRVPGTLFCVLQCVLSAQNYCHITPGYLYLHQLLLAAVNPFTGRRLPQKLGRGSAR